MIKEIVVTKDDFKAYSKYACSRITPPKENGFKSFFINFVIWFVVAVVFFTIFQSKDFSLSKLHWPTALLTSVPFLLFIVVFIGNLKKIEKRSIPQENGLMLGKRTIEISESGIKDTNNLGTSTYSWQALQDIVVHKNNVYLFLDTMLAQIIPSSAFKNESEAKDFVSEIEKLHIKLLQPNANASAE